ncbi:cupin domain-containing protein [Arenibacter lacus]|uniref:cupin domain-containing protein n=1 Tax=Arenibacter lacus TaxID=2608629 RepID=UPI00123D984D|nr:cupin domain-containing protein [Arenibacter lacus]
MSQMTKAYIAQPGTSELRWTGETSTYFLATGGLTGETICVVEEQAIRGESIPLHKHDDMECFYILEGEVMFYFGVEPGTEARAGAFVHIPGNTIHGFRIESEIARYLILTTPRHGEFYRAISLPATRATIGDEIIEQACQQYEVELVGPLPN